MKVVWILNGCGLEDRSITGSPVRFQAVSSRWRVARADVEQMLLTTSGGASMLRRMGCDLPVALLPASLLLKREPFKAFRLWSYLLTAASARLMARRLPTGDLVVTVSDYFCDIAPALLMKRRQPGLRWIAWMHHRERPPAERPGNRVANEATWRMQAWSLGQIARHADQAWTLDSDAGDDLAADLRARGMPDSRIRRMRNGIDLQAILGTEAGGCDDGASMRPVDAVMVGVRPNKGAFDIVPVWREAQRLRPGSTLRLMGGMAGEGPVLEHIARAGLSETIEVLRPEGGWLPPAAFFARLRAARLLFAPSHEEGWGMALCEAMACGLPVVAYDLPVYRRVYGDGLVTVPEGDHLAFAQAMVRLLDDPAARADLAARGRKIAAQYDWDSIAREDFDAAEGLMRARVRGSSRP